jgi:hypothetical protein
MSIITLPGHHLAGAGGRAQVPHKDAAVDLGVLRRRRFKQGAGAGIPSRGVKGFAGQYLLQISGMPG